MVTAAAAAVIGVAGCGGDTSATPQGVGAGTETRLADCDDWNSSSTEERLVTIGQLTEINTGQSEVYRGKILGDDQAYDILEAQCEPEFAGAFKLYKLYGRAAAFVGH
jgi:hypothetical protein